MGGQTMSPYPMSLRTVERRGKPALSDPTRPQSK